MKRYKKVLLVDDDDIVNSINKVIIQHAKFAREVVSVTSVPSAINFMNEAVDNGSIPEVIFLDLNMPDRDGWDFVDEFKKLESAGKTKIIMLTSSISIKDEKRAKDSKDVIAFISKPLSPELLEKIYSTHLAS